MKKLVPLLMTVVVLFFFFSDAITFFYLFQRQRRRFRLRAALRDLVAQASLLLLVFQESGVMHHGQMGSLASVQARENVL